MIRTAARLALGAALVYAGVAHFRVDEEFLGQVPTWFPARLAVVHVSGVVELALGALLVVVPREVGGRPWRARLGVVVALFLVAVFPGNVSQWARGSDSFGLDTDAKRLLRLPFQPLLVAWALWCTGAWTLLRTRSGSSSRVSR